MEKNVVISYLEKIYQDLYEEKLNVERTIQKKKTLRNNNQRFVDTLQKSLDNNFEPFSPRKLNTDNHNKILSLQREQNLLESEILKLEEDLNKIAIRLEELEAVLNTERENIKDFLEKSRSLSDIKAYHRKILKVYDSERQQIAKQLYDTMIQNYDQMIHKIEVCSCLINVDVMGSHKELSQMADYMKSSMQNMLQMVYDIPFFPLEEWKLEELIEKELSLIKNENIEVFYEIKGSRIEIENDIKFTVIKIIKESCDNVIKYANAKNLNIQLYYEEKYIILVIEDNGNGFDLQILQDENRVGMGITSMKQRLFLLDGKLDIKTTKGKGTKVIAEIPLYH